MRLLPRLLRTTTVLTAFGLSSYIALQFGTGGLWRGLEVAHAVTSPGQSKAPYDLTQLTSVNETLNIIRNKYVEPGRVKPRQMFLGALNAIQREVAQVIVHHEEKSKTVRVQVETESSEFRVDNIQGPWDVAARLREVFVFLQANLKDTELDLREVEYAACNGMLHTLDPHSTFLSPEAFKDMNASTSGHFGGLGIVITLRDQMLTVQKPLPSTPAARAGIRRLDRITKINNESTLNMPLEDAVGRLRGAAGSKVTIWVHRDGPDGWADARPFELLREEIRVKAIESRGLGNGVGYVKIKQFQASTADELDDALSELHKKEKLKALVLDLRNNPGGLLDQAAKVADRFLDSGVIVATVGAAEGRKEERAVRPGTEPNYPIVVLVNGGSASASEIVVGALKNLERAVVVGETTFGKGTVQLVFPHVTPDNAALKVTIAQYLIPGDYSIQGVGVTPDVELDPMTADPLEMDLNRESTLHERDLSKSLAAGGARRASEPPYFKLKYNLPEPERAKLQDPDTDENDLVNDFPTRIAKELAARLTPGRRAEQLPRLHDFLEKAQAQEIEALRGDLAKLDIDWGAPPKDGDGLKAGDYEIKVATDRADDTVTAGEAINLKVSVKNKGRLPVYQLRAVTKSDAGYYDGRELVFGRINPGETKVATTPLGWCLREKKNGNLRAASAKRTCKIPLSADMRADIVKVRFSAEGSEAPLDAEFRPTIAALPRPSFAYNYQIVDNRPGNGDGQVSRGEGVTVYMTVKNVGKGPSHETQANLRNLTGDGLFLHAGRFDMSNMKPGEERSVAFTFDVLDSVGEDHVTFALSVDDREIGVTARERVKLPLVANPLALKKAEGKVEVSLSAAVHSQPLAASPVVGNLEKAAIVERLGSFGNFVKVGLGEGRFGFVDATSVKEHNGAPLKLSFKPQLNHSPPQLDVVPSKLAVRDDKVKIEAKAVDPDRVLDAFVFVGPRKVHYQSNRKAQDPTKLKLDLDAELRPGINVIRVIARESTDTATGYTMIIRRDGANGEPLPTVKASDASELGDDWDFDANDE